MRIFAARNIVHTKGFTMVEVIVVIVILSVLAVLGSKFVYQSTKSYEATQTRARLINTGRQAVESMSRQLRVSLSYSVRVTNANTCLEFMPIVGGGNYIDPVPDTANAAAAASAITVSPHSVVSGGSAQYVTIGAASSTEVYGANNNDAGTGVGALSRATLSSRTVTSLTLSAAKIWKRNSLGQHFFLLEAPKAFCIVSNQLRFYSGQDVTSASVNTAGAYSVMADNVTVSSPFSVSTGTENRNTVVSFNITFVKNSESIALNQTVMIRNVP